MDQPHSLSAPMTSALETIRRAGRIVRLPGGYWVTPEQRDALHIGGDAYEIPKAYIRTQTILALEARGLVQRDDCEGLTTFAPRI